MNINLSQSLSPQPIPIGFDGEHNAENLIFTLSDKLKDADYYVVLFTNNDVDVISERLYASNNTVTISLPQSVMFTGLLKAQLVAFTAADIAKSPVILFDVGCSIDMTDTPIGHDTSDILGDLSKTLNDLKQSNIIRYHAEFPASPSEGDVFCLTSPATTSLKNYGFAKENWNGSEELNRPYIHAVDVPLSLSFDVDTSKVPMLDDSTTDFYGLIIINKLTEDLGAIVYGTIDEVSDKCFWMYEKSRGDDETQYIKLAYVHAGTTVEGTTLIDQTGWYYITYDEQAELSVFTPISEVDPAELAKAKIDNANVYDIYYSANGVYAVMTDAVFDKLAVCTNVTLNPSIYKYTNGRWIDVLYHGVTQRFIEDAQWNMYND